MYKISKELETVINQILNSQMGLSLKIVIEDLEKQKVLPFERNNEKDIKVLNNLRIVAEKVLTEINIEGIKRSRPNEVGNDIEIFVINSLKEIGYEANTPFTKKNKRKSSGYPDIEFKDENGRWNYLECKTYNIENIDSTLRSFYLSPSKDSKISKDAHHFGISFELYVEKSVGNMHIYKVKGWKILDLSELRLDIKIEFNSDNKRLYDQELILDEFSN